MSVIIVAHCCLVGQVLAHYWTKYRLNETDTAAKEAVDSTV